MSEQTVVIATQQYAHLALLSSSIHYFWWTVKANSTMRADSRYTPSEGFETFPQPSITARMDKAGRELESARRFVMLRDRIGLTELYNRVFSERVEDSAVERLRQAHIEVDEAVRDAYAMDEEREPQIREFEAKIASDPLPSWREIDFRNGFYETQQGVRFTISPQARVDVLDKLLALNHYRYQQEVSQGLHSKKGGRKGAKTVKKQPKGTGTGPSTGADATDSADGAFDRLFAPPGALF